MTDTIDIRDIERYLAHEGKLCASIYMPATPVSDDDRDRIRLKNLIGEAEERLLSAGMRRPEAEALLAAPRELLGDGPFWKHQDTGLVVLVAPELFEVLRLPRSFDERVVVGRHFHLRPLLPLVAGSDVFLVLALSRDEVRLLRGSRYGVADITPDGLPAGRADALRYDDPESRLQYHTASGPAGGERRPAMFHGHGEGDHTEEEDERDRRYLQVVEQGLQDVLAQSKVPMVLAGVERLLASYRSVSDYGAIVDEVVSGNPEILSAPELRGAAWNLVGPIWDAAVQEEAAAIEERLGTGLASSQLEDIVAAAHDGRVAALLVAQGETVWGTFDASTNAVTRHGEQTVEARDLVDLAAIRTLVQGGVVHAVDPGLVPGGGPAAARFRYAAPVARPNHVDEVEEAEG